MLPTKFRFIWPSSFREDFKKSANQKQELPVAAILDFRSALKNRNFVEDLPMIIPGQFGFNCPSGFREEAF
jgi:hypothetical protein